MTRRTVNFFSLASDDKSRIYRDLSALKNISNPIILEKDYWVCWTLNELFDSEYRDILLFKGGTSLSKIYKAIDRFSEDVDLGILPAALGWEKKLEHDPGSNTGRRKQMEKLQEDCAEYIKSNFMDRMQNLFERTLKPDTFKLTISAGKTGKNADIIFTYPRVLDPYPGYIAPDIKLEFGSLSNQEPVESSPIKPLLNHDTIAFNDFTAKVNALSIKRTFWEKATILHSVIKRSCSKPEIQYEGKKAPSRSSRHFYDFYMLWKREDLRNQALARIDLLSAVADFKTRFFTDKHSQYETAKTGSLRLCPSGKLFDEVKYDYNLMQDMFFKKPPGFEKITETLLIAEKEINSLAV